MIPAGVAYLIFSLITVTESQWPVTRWTSIQYPSWQRCIQERDDILASLDQPTKKRIRELQGVTIGLKPMCSKEAPQVWIIDGVKQ
jgi:hypothetical protein